MKRDFLEGLGLEAGVVDKIMAENGHDIEREKGKYADYEDLKAQLKKADETIEKFADYDDTKAAAEKYKAEAEETRKEAAAKISKMEMQAKIKEFTGSKKFVNNITRDGVNAKLEAMLADESSKGKSLEDIFNAVIKDQDNILVDDKKVEPPVITKMGGSSGNQEDVADAKARLVMGLPPLKD